MTAQPCRGLKVMIDLVINHCAIDSPLTRSTLTGFCARAGWAIANSGCQHMGETGRVERPGSSLITGTRAIGGLYHYC